MALTEVTGETFAQEVLASDRPVLVDFWGPRCQPCLALMPAIEALAAEYAASLKVVKVNANARPNWELCRTHGVMGLPAYLFFSQGKEIRRITSADAARDALEEAVATIVGHSGVRGLEVRDQGLQGW